LREAIMREDEDDEENETDSIVVTHLEELPSRRASALEARTIEDKLAAWLPKTDAERRTETERVGGEQVDDAFELSVDITTVTSTVFPSEGARSALLLKYRRQGSRALVPAREVMEGRGSRGNRSNRLIDLVAPYHLDRNALVAVRGQASLV